MSARGQGWAHWRDAPNANQFQTEFVNPADQAMEAGAIGHRAPQNCHSWARGQRAVLECVRQVLACAAVNGQRVDTR
jgi:hypothetical protein